MNRNGALRTRGEPRLVVDSDEFIRDALFNLGRFNPSRHCHRPILARSGKTNIGQILSFLKGKPGHRRDDAVDEDVILLWSEEKRVITGADVLGRLLRGIARNPAMEGP
jgi:metal transporter CNNM